MHGFRDKIQAGLDSRDVPADHGQATAEVSDVSGELDIALEAARIEREKHRSHGGQGYPRHARHVSRAPKTGTYRVARVWTGAVTRGGAPNKSLQACVEGKEYFAPGLGKAFHTGNSQR